MSVVIIGQSGLLLGRPDFNNFKPKVQKFKARGACGGGVPLLFDKAALRIFIR